MKWLDGSDIDIKNMTGESLCEKLSDEMYDHDYEEWLSWDEPVRTATFIIEFDTEFNMDGIFLILENSFGQYMPEVINAFRAIGDDNDADVLSEICRIAPPGHELSEEVAERIEELREKLYLYTDFDPWPLLFGYLDDKLKSE